MRIRIGRYFFIVFILVKSSDRNFIISSYMEHGNRLKWSSVEILSNDGEFAVIKIPSLIFYHSICLIASFELHISRAPAQTDPFDQFQRNEPRERLLDGHFRNVRQLSFYI